MSEREVKLMEIFLNGWHGAGDNFSVSYRTNNLEHCLKDAMEDCVIIDKRACPNHAVAVAQVMDGPMVDVRLAERTVDKFNREAGDVQMFLGPGGVQGEYRTLLQKAVKDKVWSGLDRVSLDIYTDLWRELGARVGKHTGGEVEWEDT